MDSECDGVEGSGRFFSCYESELAAQLTTGSIVSENSEVKPWITISVFHFVFITMHRIAPEYFVNTKQHPRDQDKNSL